MQGSADESLAAVAAVFFAKLKLKPSNLGTWTAAQLSGLRTDLQSELQVHNLQAESLISAVRAMSTAPGEMNDWPAALFQTGAD